MSEFPWPAGSATALGPMPGTDIAEAAEVVFGELPDFPHVPDLPARGVGADRVGRTAAFLVDIPVEVAPTGYRVAESRGRHHQRGLDLLHWDMDGLERVAQQRGLRESVLKVQAAGPWTLAAGIELHRGHRVMTDHGALREFATSLVEGVTAHVAELRQRTGAQPVVQLDEPSLPEILAGALPTPSGYGTVPSVPAPEVQSLLSSVVERLEQASGAPAVLHCGGPRPPIAVLRGAGARVLSVDATRLDGAPGSVLDEVGEAWDSGAVFLLGLVPGTEQSEHSDLYTLAEPAFRLVDRLGFSRSILAERGVPTPTCGFSEARWQWVRRGLAQTRDLGKVFVEPPQGW